MSQSLWLCSNCFGGTILLNMYIFSQDICVFFNTIIAVISCQLVRIYSTVQYIPWLWIHTKAPPPPPKERRAKLCQWRKHILSAEGGISCAMLRKCSPLGQIRREQKMPGPLLLVYFMGRGDRPARLDKPVSPRVIPMDRPLYTVRTVYSRDMPRYRFLMF